MTQHAVKLDNFGNGKTLMMFQAEGLMFLDDAGGNALIADQMGLGKAQPMHAKILTPTGWAHMRDMQVGTKIINSEGGTSQVIGVYPQDNMPIYKVSFSDGSSTRCTDDHLWLVNSPYRRWYGSPPRVKTLKDIRKRLRDGAGNAQHFIPMVEPIEFDEQELPLNPYLVGCLIGDGGLAHQVMFSSADDEIIESIKAMLPEGHSLNFSDRYDWRISGNRQGVKDSNLVQKRLRDMGLMGHKSGTKFIPNDYLYASIESRTSLLQGLLDTDGYVSEDSLIEFSSASNKLAMDVMFLVQSLGGRATYHVKKTTHQDAHRLIIALPESIMPFRLSRKADRYHPREKYPPSRCIVDVEYAGMAWCQCIATDAPDHLYITDDCIVTHNTIQALAYLALHPEMRPAVIVCPASLKLNWQREEEAWLETDDRIEVVQGGKVHELTKDYELRAGIVIINYDILKKWLSELQRIQPEMLILDESHNCFPYDTIVHTDHGMLAIGDIVENARSVKVLCRDLCIGKIEWRRVTHYFKSPKPISTIKINHEYGEIISTPNHRIWTAEGYTTAEEIRSGTYLRVLRETVHDSEKGKSDSEVLLTSVCDIEKIGRSGVSQTTEQSNAKTDGTEDLRMVRETLRNQITRQSIRETEVLQRQLCSIVEDDTIRTKREIPTSDIISARGEARNEIAGNRRTNEAKQPNAQPGNTAEGIRDLAGDGSQTEPTGWKRKTLATASTNVAECSGGGLASRTRSSVGSLQGRIPNTLQDRHSKSTTDDSDRSGRQFPLQPDVAGSEKGYEIIWSRVDDVEVLESSDIGGYGIGNAGCESVYNIEVEEHHNYFANSVLVANCKNPKAARSKAAKELAAVVPHKILLTGTPVLNRPSDLRNQLEMIAPDTYNKANWFSWHLRYTAAHKIHIGQDKTAWDFTGASNLDELAQSLKSIMIRRTKEQVLPELPAKRRSTVLIPIDNRKEYDRADKEFMAWLTEQKGAEAAERAGHVEQLAKREYLKQVAIKGKMVAAIDWIKTFLESGEKLIVFGTHRSTIETLMSEFSDCAVSVIGGMKAEAKDAAVNAFQNDPDVRLFVGNIQAAGVGLTLTAASNVAFLELADGPEMLKQCEDRAHRIGQENAVNCWYLLAENTIDGKMVEMVESKREVIDQITEEEHGLGFDLFDLIKDGE